MLLDVLWEYMRLRFSTGEHIKKQGPHTGFVQTPGTLTGVTMDSFVLFEIYMNVELKQL